MPNSVPGTPETLDIAKAQARRLASSLSGKVPMKHSQALELVARIHGQQSWGHLRSVIEMNGATEAGPAVRGTLPATPQDNDIVFSRVSGADIIDICYTQMKWRGYTLHTLTQVLEKLDCGVKYRDDDPVELSYFSKISLGDLRQAEHKRQVETGSTYDGFPVSDKLFSLSRQARPVAPSTDNPDCNMHSALDQFKDLTRFEVTGLDMDLLLHLPHILSVGSTAQALQKTLPRAIDLSSNRLEEQIELSERMGVPLPPEGFENPVSALKFLMKMRRRTPDRSARTPIKTPIIVKMTDLVESRNLDVLMAQARSNGIIVVACVDSMELEMNAFRPALEFFGVLMSTTDGEMTARSKWLEPTTIDLSCE